MGVCGTIQFKLQPDFILQLSWFNRYEIDNTEIKFGNNSAWLILTCKILNCNGGNRVISSQATKNNTKQHRLIAYGSIDIGCQIYLVILNSLGCLTKRDDQINAVSVSIKSFGHDKERKSLIDVGFITKSFVLSLIWTFWCH